MTSKSEMKRRNALMGKPMSETNEKIDTTGYAATDYHITYGTTDYEPDRSRIVEILTKALVELNRIPTHEVSSYAQSKNYLRDESVRFVQRMIRKVVE